MEKEQLGQLLNECFPGFTIEPFRDTFRIKADAAAVHPMALILHEDDRLKFDYLINMYGIDFEDHFAISYHFESTRYGTTLFAEIAIANHEAPSVDTVSDIWKTAQYQEREIYDLMGVRFHHHPDLRRLFLEDGWGFPLRKDYTDEINVIER